MARQPQPLRSIGRCIQLLALPLVAGATPTVNRRGGGTNPVTDDPATIPTTPPSSNYQNGVPKIAGSEGGFIGLIVGLGILLITASLLTWYILRRRRLQREKRRTDALAPGPGTAPYDTKTSFPKPSRGIFGGLSLGGGGGGNGKRGWIKAGEGRDRPDDADAGIELRGGRKGQGPYLASDPSGAFSSASTIRLAPPELSIPGGGYKDPYSPGASREELVSPVGEVSPSGEEGERGYERVEGGQRRQEEGEGEREGRGSQESAGGRFAGGTRFRESL